MKKPNAEQLQQKLEAQEDYLSMLIHQLRSPLTGTRWTLEMMLNGDVAPLDQHQRLLIQEAYDKNQRMIKFLSEANAAQDRGSWELDYHMSQVDLADIVESAISLYLRDARTRELAITFDRPNQTRTIRADAEKMLIVMENLIENAVKYTEPHQTIEVRLGYDDQQAQLTVSNPGSTIEPGEEARVFEKSFRGSRAADSHVHGTGLGLFMSQRIVEGHDGTMTYRVDEDQHTIVAFSLPFVS